MAGREEERARVMEDNGGGPAGLHQLPIAGQKQEILDIIEGNQIVVVSGPTGCGKSTQVPQYILDQHAKNRKDVKIIVTQPRKIAASSLAKRVCQERSWQLGGLVGYQVGLDRENKSEDTRLLYVTTGVLKKMIIERKHLNNWTHIILDEVHEREEDMDIVMLLCRKLLGTNSRTTKLILMSATLNEVKLKQYFFTQVAGFGRLEAPSLRIVPKESPSGRKDNVISTEYYEELARRLGTTELTSFQLSRAKFHPDCVKLTKKLLLHLDSLEEEEGKRRGGVLIFLPGIQEIKVLRDHLMDESSGGGERKWKCLPLHSRIPWEDQRSVFNPTPDGRRKVILSTNIAESSITVPDIRYVIDFGLTKNVAVDSETNNPMLVLDWASRSQLVQRKGRAGRVTGDGRVYVLLPASLVSQLPEEHIPEIQRIPLTKVVLDVKQLDMGSPRQLLQLAMDPPNSENLVKTILSLKEMRALLSTVKGVTAEDDGDLTVLGEIVAKIPVDVKLGKLIVLGHIVGVLEEAIIIAAGLNGKGIFSAPFDKRVQTYKNKLCWADQSFNDCFSILHAYQTWQTKRKKGDFNHRSDGPRARNLEDGFLQINFLQKNQLLEMEMLITEITNILSGLDIVSPRHKNCLKWEGESKYWILEVIMFGAFYPNYFTKLSTAEAGLNAERVLSGRDPWNTVYLQGMKDSQSKVGEIYTRQIKEMLKECTSELDKMRISFEGKKIFVEFEECGGIEEKRISDRNHNKPPEGNLTGDILHQVYVALKLRKTGRMLELYPDEVAHTKYREWEERLSQEVPSTVTVEQVRPPLIGTESLTIRALAHISSPTLFWVHYGENVVEKVKEIKRFIKKVQSVCPYLESPEDVKIGGVFLAQLDSSTSSYLRARVISDSGLGKFTVFFIDNGQSSVVEWTDLKSLQSQTELTSVPGLALQCSLSGLQPAGLRACRVWDQSVRARFTQLLEARDLREIQGDIFSVTRSMSDQNIFILNLETLRFKSKGKDIDMKQFLLEEKLADVSSESMKSQSDHRERMRFAAFSPEMQNYLKENYFSPPSSKVDLQLMTENPREFRSRIGLQGPFSPLQHPLLCQYKAGMGRITNIDQDSVNSVLLDQNPSDTVEQWLVAGQVGMSADGETQVARNTFWLGEQPGTGALLTLVFAPQVELRLSKTKTLTGFIAGLGPQVKDMGALQVEKRKSSGLYPEHDMEIKLNVRVDNEDIMMVNKLRYWLNMMMMKTSTGDMVMTQPKALQQAQREIKKDLENLLEKRRIPVEKVGVPIGEEFSWNLLDPSLKKKKSEMKEPGFYLFKKIEEIDLTEVSVCTEDSIVEGLVRLMNLGSEFSLSPLEVPEVCPLCPEQLLLTTPRDIWYHCDTKQHVDRLDRILE